MTAVKFLLLGDECTKKSSFALCWTTNNTPGEYIPSCFDNYEASLQVGDQELLINLWDTAGQRDYAKLRPLSYPGTDVVLMFFSYDSVESLENVSSYWVPEVTEHIGRPLVLILVGTSEKLVREDHEVLEARGESPFGEYPVKHEMVEKVMEDIGPDAFMYCSTRDSVTTNRVVYKAAEIYLEKKKQEKGEAKKKHKRRWWQRKGKRDK